MTTQQGKQRVDCRFCSLLAGDGDAFDSIWLSEGNYRSVVSVGALVPGWSLLCPVAHVVNLVDEYKSEDFWRFAVAAELVLQQRYRACAFFEHGASSELSLTGCGVGHAHGHLVPLNFSLEAEARSVAPEFGWTDCRASDVGAIASGREYLFVASKFQGASTTGSLCVLEQPTSQFFRRLIAGKLGIGDMYDYKKYPMLEIAGESAHQLRAFAATELARV